MLGANTIPELVALDAALRARSALRLMLAGVTIFRPETCVIDAEVEVGADTVIEPFVQLLGTTRIGSDCLIRSGTVIETSTVADGVLIHDLPKPNPVAPVEFPVPPEVTADGAVTFTWNQEPGRGGNGRGCQVAEVWLVRDGR